MTSHCNNMSAFSTCNKKGGSLFFGMGPPDRCVGSDGDFYVDTLNSLFYGPKICGIWGTTSLSLQGIQGPPGESCTIDTSNFEVINLTVTGSITANDITVNNLNVIGSITFEELNITNISADEITVNNLIVESISADDITVNNLNVIGSITFEELNITSISADQITVNNLIVESISADDITVQSINADEIIVNNLIVESISADEITVNTLIVESISADEITVQSISADEITVNTLIVESISADNITVQSISADEITVNNLIVESISADNITVQSINADEITVQSISADEITVNILIVESISADEITVNNITVQSISADEITVNNLTITGSVSLDELNIASLNATTINADQIITDDLVVNNNITTNGDIAGNNFTSSNSISARYMNIGNPPNPIDEYPVDTRILQNEGIIHVSISRATGQYRAYVVGDFNDNGIIRSINNLYLSSDFGKTYSLRIVGNNSQQTDQIRLADVSMSANGQYIIATNSFAASFGIYYLSNDFGNIFTAFSVVTPTPLYSGNLTAVSNSGRYMMISTVDRNNLPIGSIYYSSDFGQSFTSSGPETYWGAGAIEDNTLATVAYSVNNILSESFIRYSFNLSDVTPTFYTINAIDSYFQDVAITDDQSRLIIIAAAGNTTKIYYIDRNNPTQLILLSSIVLFFGKRLGINSDGSIVCISGSSTLSFFTGQVYINNNVYSSSSPWKIAFAASTEGFGFNDISVTYDAFYQMVSPLPNTILEEISINLYQAEYTPSYVSSIYPRKSVMFSLGRSDKIFYELYLDQNPIVTSDARKKKNIQECDLGLNFIDKLRPVKYTMTNDISNFNYGLISQDVRDVLLDINMKPDEFSGYVHERINNEDFYALKYSDFISPLIKANQELHELIKKQAIEIELIKKRLN